MINEHQDRVLREIRARLVSAGFHVTRIRTIFSTRWRAEEPIYEAELKQQQSPSSADWCPADLYHWLMDAMGDGYDFAGIEYRRGIWFARFVIVSEDERQSRAGQLPLVVPALGEQLGSGSVGENLLESLDKFDIPF
jgi:hypothetical protein